MNFISPAIKNKEKKHLALKWSRDTSASTLGYDSLFMLNLFALFVTIFIKKVDLSESGVVEAIKEGRVEFPSRINWKVTS